MPSFCSDQENVPGVNISGQKVMVCLSSEGLKIQFNLSDFSSYQIMSKYVGVVINHSWSRCLGAYCSFPRSWRAIPALGAQSSPHWHCAADAKAQGASPLNLLPEGVQEVNPALWK